MEESWSRPMFGRSRILPPAFGCKSRRCASISKLSKSNLFSIIISVGLFRLEEFMGNAAWNSLIGYNSNTCQLSCKAGSWAPRRADFYPTRWRGIAAHRPSGIHSSFHRMKFAASGSQPTPTQSHLHPTRRPVSSSPSLTNKHESTGRFRNTIYLLVKPSEAPWTAWNGLGWPACPTACPNQGFCNSWGNRRTLQHTDPSNWSPNRGHFVAVSTETGVECGICPPRL